MVIYLLKDYNKYSNRRLITTDLADVQDKICGIYQNINFVEKDGVNTDIILNRNILEATNPDYLMAVSSTDGEYSSNWFITSSTRLRTGQVKYTLKRDLIRDNLDSIKNSTLFINKGYVPNSHPLFFNPEPITVNEILTKSTYLNSTYDSKMAWLVAYLAKDQTSIADKTIKFGNAVINPDITTKNESTLISAYNLSAISYQPTNVNFYVNDGSNTDYLVTVNVYSNTLSYQVSQMASVTSWYKILGMISNIDKQAVIDAVANNSVCEHSLSTLENYAAAINNKTVKFTASSNYYKYTAEVERESFMSVSKSYSNQSINTDIAKALGNANMVNGATTKWTTQAAYKIVYSSTDITTTTDSLTYNNRNHTMGTSYDVVCCPYGYYTSDGTFKQPSIFNGLNYKLNPDLCKDLFTSLSQYLGSSYVYDVQLLPFCPIKGLNYLASNSAIDITTLDASCYTWSTSKEAILFYSRDYEADFYIPYTINPYPNKASYVTHKFKLVSPNYSSELEIDPNKNGGINGFHVQMTCLPYQPWINVHPKWNWLNGIDNDDNKGLILGGSFSLSMESSAWTDYQYTNSNYSQIFESQLAYQKYQQKMSIATNVVAGVTSGLSTGIQAGALAAAVPGAGLFGAAAGIGAAGLSLAGMGADLAIQNQMNNKSNAFMTTQFNLSVGNIQAQPSVLSKITAYNINTKLHIMLYEYTCTTEEQGMVNNYFKYNGMTINTCGSLTDFINPTEETFISARIIRWNETAADQSDYNYLENINSELSQGVYICQD